MIGRVPDDGESFACEDGICPFMSKGVQRHMVEEAVVELYRETIDNEDYRCNIKAEHVQ